MGVDSGGVLIDLSAQQLVDCNTGGNQDGCDGGSLTASFSYVNLFGLDSYNDYPYKDKQGSCKVTTPLWPKVVYLLELRLSHSRLHLLLLHTHLLLPFFHDLSSPDLSCRNRVK